jgi:hypothetical protein
MERLGATVFRDASPEEFQPLFYDLMDMRGEASFDKIPTTGLTAEYVARETKRAIAGVKGSDVQIYPGIDIDVPTKRTDKRTTPEDVRRSVKAAIGAGANGVVLSREYTEMWLANLTAAGDTLRQEFAKSTR